MNTRGFWGFFLKKKDRSGGEDDEGAALWKSLAGSVKAYTQQGRKPLAKKSVAVDKPAPRGRGSLAAMTVPARAAASRPVFDPPRAKSSGGFDRSTESKLKKGRLPIEGRLDLHGMTQDEAWRALSRFIPAAVREEKRTVLVITGKGRVSESGGVLRRMVPIWLTETELRRHVIGITAAQPKDGGSGALYVRLRRNDR